MRKRRGDPVHGWLILDKPEEMTSTRAVAVVKRVFNARKAGHGGTLDPLASGLLPIALGEATKTVAYAMDGLKTYRFTVRWGQSTTTDDREGVVVAESAKRPSSAEIEAILPRFEGLISQRPPQFSAIKIDGARAYDLARKGAEVELKDRQVMVRSLKLENMPDADHAGFEVVCGKGTYVRALARDMGALLGCLGHVWRLRRVAVGPFGEAHMISLDKLESLRHIGAAFEHLNEVLHPVETALADIPALAVSRVDAARLKQGQAVVMRGRDAPILPPGTIYVACKGSPIALVEVVEGALRPKRIFNLAG